MNLLKKQSEFINGVMILLGLVFSSLAYNLFLVPNHIAAGGFTGIAQLINSFTGWPVGAISLAMNVPLFIFSMKSLGLRFGIRSLIATIGLSLLIDYLKVPVLTEDLLLSSVYGGLFCGVGFGLILRGSATTGGTDMLASLIHRLIPRVRVSIAIFVIDALVIVASAFVFDMERAMYALFCTLVCNIVIDFVLEGPNSSHSFFIISDKAEEISARIMTELERGVTALKGKGMYSGGEKLVLLCVVSRVETPLMRRIVFSTDPKAFVISSKAHETLGEGFKEHK
ncbi:MAG: YitT family protein [Clostridia bacterium]|nr:YitT family protein [Clostridia bacterium]